MLRILNSQTREKEEFRPIDPGSKHVSFYTCGPTVYDSLHLGHARAAVVPDMIRRYLEYRGYQVRYVTNFTDVDDKIIKRSLKDGVDWRELTDVFIQEYHRIMLDLGNKPADVYPRATDHITDMVAIVQSLVDRKHAYVAADGDVYFDIASYERYGALSKRKLEEETEHGQGRVDEARMKVKKNHGDFVLWKLSKNDPAELLEAGEAVPRWPSPWGDGRPGWHLECSAMSQKYLGVPFELHGGGKDLLFPHHEDEKAQTECAFCDDLAGQESVRYWVHNEFVTVKDGKMGKSEGNAKWLHEMVWPDGPHDPMALRMMLLSSHYRSPLNFDPEMLDEAQARLERIYNTLDRIAPFAFKDPKKRNTVIWKLTTSAVSDAFDPSVPTLRVPLISAVVAAKTHFIKAMDDDFNTAGALGALFELVTMINQELGKRVGGITLAPSDQQGFRLAHTTIQQLLDVLGIRPFRATRQSGGGDGDEGLIDLLMKARLQARDAKQFQLADGIRDGLTDLGYEIRDVPGGKWEVKKK